MPDEIEFELPISQYEFHKIPVTQYIQEGYDITDCYVSIQNYETKMTLDEQNNKFTTNIYQPQINDYLELIDNYQLDFNGTGQVSIPHSAILNPVIPFTIELWVKFHQLTDNTAYWLLGKGTSTSGQGGYDFVMDISSGQFRFNLVKYYIIDQRININQLTTDTWYHFQAVQTSTQVTYYINGDPVGSYTHSGNYQTNSTNMYMGKNRTTIISSDFIMDEVRFWNIERSQQDIQSTMNYHLKGDEQGLQGYWNFNEGSNDIVQDSSVNQNNGSKNDGATWITVDTPTGYDYQLSFDGVDDYITISNSVGNTSQYTFSIYYKFNSVVSTALINNFNYQQAQQYYGIAWRYDTGVIQQVHLQGGQWGTQNQHQIQFQPTQNEWYHLQITYDGSIGTIYLNGDQISTKALPVPTFNVNTILKIGTLEQLQGFAQFMNGEQSEQRIYNYQLTEQEIQQTMNTPLIGNEEGLVQYYKLNENEGRIAYDYANENNGIIVGDPVWVLSDQPIEADTQLQEFESMDYLVTFRYLDNTSNEYTYSEYITILNILNRNRYYYADRLIDLQRASNINIAHNLR